MHIQIETKRLRIRPITLTDAKFIFNLVNAEGWHRFIGDRNVSNIESAQHYIQNILDKSNTYYNVIELLRSGNPVGVVTLLKREDEVFPDIGFALLPEFEKEGYALEATKTYLEQITSSKKYDNIIGITLSDNHSSISLLQKIGMTYQFDRQKEDQILSYYSLRKLMPTQRAGLV